MKNLVVEIYNRVNYLDTGPERGWYWRTELNGLLISSGALRPQGYITTSGASRAFKRWLESVGHMIVTIYYIPEPHENIGIEFNIQDLV